MKNEKKKKKPSVLSVGLFVLIIKILPKISKVLGKLFLVLLKTLKGAKVGKTALAAGSFGAYAYVFSWQFAVIIISMLFVHESGHIWAMRRYKMKTRGIYLIPFLGAAAVADEDFPSRKAESFIAIMGPIWGFAITFACYICYLITNNLMFAAAAAWMAMVNMFNLLPINPLDGGRIFKSVFFSISTRAGLIFMLIGIIVMSYVFFSLKLGLFLILIIVGGLDLLAEWHLRGKRVKKLEGSLHDIRENKECVVLNNDIQSMLIRVEKETFKDVMKGKMGETRKDLERTFDDLIRRSFPGQALSEEDKEKALIELNDAEKETLDEISKIKKPKMTKMQIVLYVFLYLLVGAVFFTIMLLSNHAPGTEGAMEMLA